MKKLIVHSMLDLVGYDEYALLMVEDDATEDYIQETAYGMACRFAESYGYYPEEEYSDDEFERIRDEYGQDEAEGYQQEFVSISAIVEEYDPEKHDMHRPGGGSFEEDVLQFAS